MRPTQHRLCLPEDGKNKLKIHFLSLSKIIRDKNLYSLYKSKYELQYVEQTVTKC